MARTNKKDIYKGYGIEYQNGKIYSSIFGWIPKVLINGNAKIGKGCYHFSTLAGTGDYSATVNGVTFTEKGTCVCDCSGCYAMSGNYRFQSTVNALAMRTALARHALEWLKLAIIAQIKADKIRLLRVHASGDFFGAVYVKMWRDIAIACPDVQMWTYTKNADAEEAFNGIPNFNVVKSIVRGHGFNFGNCAYILSLYEALKAAKKSVYICKCGIDKTQHCTNCHHCAACEYVLFIEHGTGYDAEKDPLFPVLKALIESQAD